MENADELAYRKTLSGRWVGWETLLQNYADRPLVVQIFGNGNPSNAHNDFLIRLFSGGVVGLFIYGVLLASVAMRILKNYRRGPSPLNVMAIMIFVMWLVDTMSLHPSLYPSYHWYVWSFIGPSVRGPLTGSLSPGPCWARSLHGDRRRAQEYRVVVWTACVRPKSAGVPPADAQGIAGRRRDILV